MSVDNFGISGLTTEQVRDAREKYGYNKLEFKKENPFITGLKSLATEPMVILLLVTSSIYFISGEIGDGVFLAVAIVLVGSISLYQDSRSRNALEKLKQFTLPSCKVIRDGKVVEIHSDTLVMGDYMMVEEGTIIAADGTIVHSNDFSVNESLLTGESLSVIKDAEKENNSIFGGTTVVSGLAIARITAIGNQTRLGKIGKSLEGIAEESTPLEIQIENFVKKMVIAGVTVFLVVWGFNYINSSDLLDSLLKALTLAMSILPEEIPVAFTTFMALGAWRLMKKGVVVKQMKTVETLGGATVICVDKTGTITQNKMELAKIYVMSSRKISAADESLGEEEKQLIRMAMWASEPIPFDPMEVELHKKYQLLFSIDERSNYRMIHEYPLSGKPPMMTHVFANNSAQRIIAAKGAPEALMAISGLSAIDRQKIECVIDEFSGEGYRVLAVGESKYNESIFPPQQQDFNFVFIGLVAFYDPPKQNINRVFGHFDAAGIKVKIITGDNAATTMAIAKQIGFKNYNKSLSGDDLMMLTEEKLKETVMSVNVFTRMFPEAKLRIINALKSKNEIVAMTGDGVNDAPALKASHIGVAMGKKGTEIAKQAASLILVDDDLGKMVDAIAAGRKIYANLKKAIQYIISIHIPIILTVFLPLALGWIYPNIFSPVHVILLELIMGPTCSIIYENEPMEKNTMLQKPRPFTTTFFNTKELLTSVIQGLLITIGVLFAYQFAVSQGYSESLTRAMVFTTLISSNVSLTLVNRSFYYSVFSTLKYQNNLVLIVIVITIVATTMMLYIQPLSDFFGFESLSLGQIMLSAGLGFVFVIWYEGVKWFKRNSNS